MFKIVRKIYFKIYHLFKLIGIFVLILGMIGEVKAETCQNIFDMRLISQIEGYNAYNSETGIWTTNSGGAYGRSILYNATSLAHPVDITKVIPVQPNTTYTIYFYDFNRSASNIVMDLDFCNSTGQNISALASQNPPLITFTTPANTYYLDLLRRNNAGTFSFSKIMLVEGTYTTEDLPPYCNNIIPEPNVVYTNFINLYIDRISYLARGFTNNPYLISMIGIIISWIVLELFLKIYHIRGGYKR